MPIVNVSALLILLSALLFHVPICYAIDNEVVQQAIDEYEQSPWELGVAAGYGVRTNPLVNSEDIPLYAVLDIAWFGERFFFDNGDLGLTLHETDSLSISLIAHVNNERNVFSWLSNENFGVQLLSNTGASFADTATDKQNIDAIAGSDRGAVMEASASNSEDKHSDVAPNPRESVKVEAASVKIPRRGVAVDGGIELIYGGDWGDIQIQALSDWSFTHKGFEFWASYAYYWRFGNWRLSPSIGLNWKSSDLLDYYYGVRESEATSSRPAYHAASGFNSFARLSLAYRFNDNWSIVGVAEYENLSRSIRHSPIVDRDNIETLFIGLMYRF